MFKRVLVVACMMVMAVACSQNAKQKTGQVVEPTTTADNSSAKTDSGAKDPHATAEQGFVKPSNAGVLLDEIKKNYKGVKLSVVNSKTKKEVSKVDVPFKDKSALTSTPFSVEVESYFTNFTMDNTGAINKSMEETNPAAKIKIYKNDAVVFDGWLFQNFPEIHQFDDPDFSVLLIQGNKN